MAYTSKYTGEEIDAKLDEVKPVEVVDSLDSEDTTAALSANQGRVLKEMIEDIPSGGGGGITEEKEVYIGEVEPTDDGVKLWIDPTGTPSGGNGGGGSITLDSEMSDTSENAVSNKVIKEYVDNAAPHQFGEDFSEDFN